MIVSWRFYHSRIRKKYTKTKQIQTTWITTIPTHSIGLIYNIYLHEWLISRVNVGKLYHTLCVWDRGQGFPTPPFHRLGGISRGPSRAWTHTWWKPAEGWNNSPQWKTCIRLFGGFLKWWYPQIIHFKKVFQYKSSILGVFLYFRKHPVIGSFFYWIRGPNLWLKIGITNNPPTFGTIFFVALKPNPGNQYLDP